MLRLVRTLDVSREYEEDLKIKKIGDNTHECNYFKML